MVDAGAFGQSISGNREKNPRIRDAAEMIDQVDRENRDKLIVTSGQIELPRALATLQRPPKQVQDGLGRIISPERMQTAMSTLTTVFEKGKVLFSELQAKLEEMGSPMIEAILNVLNIVASGGANSPFRQYLAEIAGKGKALLGGVIQELAKQNRQISAGTNPQSAHRKLETDFRKINEQRAKNNQTKMTATDFVKSVVAGLPAGQIALQQIEASGDVVVKQEQTSGTPAVAQNTGTDKKPETTDAAKTSLPKPADGSKPTTA